MNSKMLFILFVLFGFIVLIFSCSGQKADAGFDATVNKPAFVSNHPKVLFDEGHRNFHTASGRYKPFVDLIKSDGYEVKVNKGTFTPELLNKYQILVISNAKGKDKKYHPAFTEGECNEVYEWIKEGGSLLLIADHYPMGSAAKILSEKFGVHMGEGFTEDSQNYDTSTRDKGQLVFDEANNLLTEHPIVRGRNANERVHRVITFTGQSLDAQDSACIVLRLSATAYDIVPDSIWEKKSMFFFTNTYTRFSEPMPSLGNAQAVALQVGKGRVVILGEAAMLTAQIIKDLRFGMNYPPSDDKQFALNIMHWLSNII